VILSRFSLPTHPDPAAPLALVTDAYTSAMGTVLEQCLDNAWQPLAFFSRRLNPAQQKYSAYDQELLAVYKAVNHFRHVLEARHFIIITDRKPITYIFQQKWDKYSPRQFNRLDFLAQFTIDIVHISGQDNVVADSFSRQIRHCATITQRTGRIAGQRRRTSNTDVEYRPATREAANSRHQGFHLLRHLCQETSTVRSSSLMAPSVPVRPRSMTPRHQSNSEAGRTAFRVARHAEGLSLPGTGLPGLSALQSLPPHCYSSERLHAVGSPLHDHIDLVRLLPTSASYTYCLTAVDSFMRWPEAILNPDITDDTVTHTLLTGCISRHGWPQTITIDQGCRFKSQLFHSLARVCGIQLSRTTTHQPTANGLVERGR
jgi:cleavage and polyadenylation specificity factor subunit 1